MTHGCIAVRRVDENGRIILLHTHHSGYLIPEIVRGVPEFYCRHRWGFIVERHKDYPDMAALKEGLDNLGFNDGMFYQPSVASLLVAHSPWVLEVIPDEFQIDMADWSGSDHPLVLVMDEQKNTWTLFNEESEQILSIDPTESMYQWLWGEIENEKYSGQSRKP